MTPRVARVRARPLDVPMSEPFEIASGAQAAVANVLVEAELDDGTRGWGECAPMPAFNGETQASALKAVRGAAAWLEGRPLSGPLSLARGLEERLGRRGAARAGLEMALLDAWARRHGAPLWSWFGAAGTSVATDVTVAIVPPPRAAAAARRIVRRGVRTIKIKVGRSVEEDLERVLAVAGAVPPRTTLLLDANQGYTPAQALSLLGRLRRKAVRPALFEQPVAQEDWDGMEEVQREGRVPVAADETVSSRKDAWRLARRPCAAVVNVKLMKYGIAEALDVVAAARSAGLGLMIGGMVESYLSMGCAAHFAAGLGGFRFVDLDTPLWFAKDPMRGPRIGRGGRYDLSRVKAGLGVEPRAGFSPAGR